MLLAIVRYLALAFHGLTHTKYSHLVIEVLGLLLAAGLGVATFRHFSVPPATVVQTNEHTTTKYVDVPVLNEKTITRYIANPKDKTVIDALLAENSALKLRVTSLTDTVAQLESSGSGPIVATSQPNGQNSYSFEDYRLKFKTDLKTADYTLSQKFIIITTTAKDDKGKPVTLVNVYEEGPNGERRPIQAQTTALFANEQAMKWYTKLNVQGGAALGPNNGALLGLQWLKRGTSQAPNDTRWAVATPVIFASQDINEAGMLPLSFNLGTVPHQPFTNIWLSPYVGINVAGRTFSRFGFAVTATF